LLRKVAYGVAVPTIVVAGVVNGHVAVKYLYVRLFRDGGKDGGEAKGKGSLMYQKTFKARGIWVAINAVLWVVAWIIAEGVPVFNDLLGLTSALFASWFTFGLSGLFWFKMNEGRWFDGWRKVVGSLVAGLCVLIGLLMVSFCFSFSLASLLALSIPFLPSSFAFGFLGLSITFCPPRPSSRGHRWLWLNTRMEGKRHDPRALANYCAFASMHHSASSASTHPACRSAKIANARWRAEVSRARITRPPDMRQRVIW